MPVDHLRLSPAWLGRIQTVFRNAIALCKGAHLQRLKAYDKKILDLATQAPSDASLRTVSTSELVSADRRLWKEISTLYGCGWSLDDALHELTTVRSDVGNLLQLRARPPPPPLRPPRDPNAPLRGKGKTGKGKTGKGNAPPLKRKTPGTPAPPDNAPLDLVTATKPFASVSTRVPALTSNANTCTHALTACRTVNPAGRITQHASTAILRSRLPPELRSRPQPGELGCSSATPRHRIAHPHSCLATHRPKSRKIAATSRHRNRSPPARHRRTNPSSSRHRHRRPPQRMTASTATPSPQTSRMSHPLLHASWYCGHGMTPPRHRSTGFTSPHLQRPGTSTA